jgi:hypothetical protein
VCIARIIAGRHGTRAASKHIEVIHVISMCGDDWMVAISDEHQIAIDESQGVVARSRGVVQALECISFGFADPVVVGFVEVHLEGRIVDVMLVGRIA